jgi:hypothetical protein
MVAATVHEQNRDSFSAIALTVAVLAGVGLALFFTLTRLVGLSETVASQIAGLLTAFSPILTRSFQAGSFNLSRAFRRRRVPLTLEAFSRSFAMSAFYSICFVLFLNSAMNLVSIGLHLVLMELGVEVGRVAFSSIGAVVVVLWVVLGLPILYIGGVKLGIRFGRRLFPAAALAAFIGLSLIPLLDSLVTFATTSDEGRREALRQFGDILGIEFPDSLAGYLKLVAVRAGYSVAAAVPAIVVLWLGLHVGRRRKRGRYAAYLFGLLNRPQQDLVLEQLHFQVQLLASSADAAAPAVDPHDHPGPGYAPSKA